MKKLVCVWIVLFVAVTAMLSVSAAPMAPIPVTNPGFDIIYKAGSTSITGTLDEAAVQNGSTTLATKSNTAVYGNIHWSDSSPSGGNADIPGWTTTADAWHNGIRNVTTGGFPSWFDTIPSGENVLQFYTAPSTVTQTLAGTTLLPDTTYVLSVWVGKNWAHDLPSTIRVELYAGASLLTPVLAVTPTPANYQFNQWTLTFETGPVPASGDLMILLGGNTVDTTNPDQVLFFDSVSLEYVIPEPASFVLLLAGCGLLAGRRRVRDR